MQVVGITIELATPISILAIAVRVGFPSPADDFIVDEIDLQRLLNDNRLAAFLVRVAGDSMMLAKLFDNDIAVVDQGRACGKSCLLLFGQQRDARHRTGAKAGQEHSDR